MEFPYSLNVTVKAIFMSKMHVMLTDDDEKKPLLQEGEKPLIEMVLVFSVSTR